MASPLSPNVVTRISALGQIVPRGHADLVAERRRCPPPPREPREDRDQVWSAGGQVVLLGGAGLEQPYARAGVGLLDLVTPDDECSGRDELRTGEVTYELMNLTS